MNTDPKQSIVSARGMERELRGNNMKMQYRAEIVAPEGWEPDPRSIWYPPSRETTDLGALRTWIDQEFLSNPSYTRAQVKIYEISYELIG